MALRSRNDALPAAVERPKKLAKVAAASATPPIDPRIADENPAPPLKPTDQAPEYIASENLKALPNPQARIESLLEELDSKDWIKVCEALNDVRRLALHHSSLLQPILENVLLVMVKAMKNPRSALCKTSIMASADIFCSCGCDLISTAENAAALDQLMLQLLLKASQDKKFVCEEAEKTLDTMAVSMLPLPLLKRFQSYVNHSNMRVRAKAAVGISKCVSKMDTDMMKEFGLAKLLQVAAELLNDRLPEAREAARSTINLIYSGFLKDTDKKEEVVDESGDSSSTADSWQDFCSSNLPPISALAIAKIVSQ